MEIKSEAVISKLIGHLFPDGTELLPSNDVGREGRYWVIPGKLGTPRWILPENPAIGMTGLRFWRPYDLASRVKWQLILAAYQNQCISSLPNVFSFGVKIPAAATWCHLGYQKRDTLMPVIYMGDPISRSKAVSFMVDVPAKQCTTVTKVPLGKSADRKILHEADILQQLQSKSRNIAPGILYRSNDRAVTAQNICQFQSPKRKLTSNHLKWLFEMQSVDQPTTLSDNVEILENRLEACGIKKNDPDYKQMDRYLASLSNRNQVPVTWVHGDFAPWNLKEKNDGSFLAIDWEESLCEGLPLYDLIHYFYVQNADKLAPDKILDLILAHPLVPQYLTRLNLSPQDAVQFYGYFLLDYWCRRLEDGDEVLAGQFYEKMLRRWLDDRK
jgi:thiamine kinase-like enzyme